jgi:predicted PurR-regulated permease PerM
MKDYPLFRPTIAIIFILALIAFLYFTRAFLIPVSIAVLFAFLLFPISRRMERWRFPRSIAIIISLLVAMAILGGLIFFFVSQVQSFASDLPQLREQVSAKMETLQAFVERKTHISEEKQLALARQNMKSQLQASGQYLMTFFTGAGTFIAMLALIPIYIFFMTYYRDKFEHFILRITKPSQHAHIKDVIERIARVTQLYLRGLLIDIAILSVLNSTGLLLLGIPHAILLGVLASVLNIIPYVGVLIGSLFPVVMALITKDSIWYAVGAAGVCTFVQFIDNNFITPKVVGSSVSLNPLSTLMVLIIGGLIWGVAGMMLFIPFMGMAKVCFDNFEKLKPLGYLIGEEKRMPMRIRAANQPPKEPGAV